jgi:hypothetical protein
VLTHAPEGQLIWHLGPRLMYSMARDGFPLRVLRLSRLLRRISRPGSLLPVFVVGEIDVRCHLVPRAGSAGLTDFVDDYVEHATRVAFALGARQLIICVPVPPSATCPANPQFPIEGSIGERVAVFDRLRDALADAVGRRAHYAPRPLLLDATDLLADDTGAFRAELTDDGCHTNAAGRLLVRQRVHAVRGGAVRQPASVRS